MSPCTVGPVSESGPEPGQRILGSCWIQGRDLGSAVPLWSYAIPRPRFAGDQVMPSVMIHDYEMGQGDAA